MVADPIRKYTIYKSDHWEIWVENYGNDAYLARKWC